MESLEAQIKPQVMPIGRVAYWDIVKAVAIFCVVWGHCLQNMTTDDDYWHTDTLCQFIYSFHMPLFMVISGYFAYNSLSRPVARTLKKKSIQLLIPSVSWFLIISFMAMTFHRDFSLSRLFDIAKALPFSFWFLKSLFMCYLITLLEAMLMRWKRWTLAVYVVVIFGLGEFLNYASTISMLPFFLAGILLHYKRMIVAAKMKRLVIMAGLVFISSFIIWDSSEYNVYLNPLYHNWGGYKALIIRIIIGAAGSVVVLWSIRLVTIKILPNHLATLLAELGTMTLGIYCVQLIMAEGLLKSSTSYVEYVIALLPDSFHHFVYNYIITLIAAVGTITVCVIVIKSLKRYRLTRIFLLGELK